MANNKMLIDASHPEETRVVVLRGNRIEEFDFESASKKPLRGNIYLAKVTRVEPSLQAAFVEYGGNRHGFLAFPEIHPDYYQIPVADRQALLEEEARERSDEDNEDEERRPQRRNNNRRRRPDDRSRRRRDNGDAVITADAPQPFAGADAPQPVPEDDAAGALPAGGEAAAPTDVGDAAPVDAVNTTYAQQAPDEQAPRESAANETAAAEQPAAASRQEIEPAGDQPPEQAVPAEVESVIARQEADDRPGDDAGQDSASEPGDDSDEDGEDEDESDGEEEEENVEQLGGDTEDFIPHPVRRTRRQYKIQEVIKRRQVLLVQVVKEERGNKGAALTTYLSLAGRYSVLMPNTARGGGISRKITDGEDRRRLKDIVQDLDVPEGMGVILRTAGASRSTDEVRRDFEYLLRMWESVRELTLRSTAPTLVYEEGSLIKRSIRDLYGKDVEEVMVAGDQGFREARDYMKMLLPGQVGNVRQWHEPAPLFTRWGVEQQLDSMFTNVVTLKSGGYIVINQTEALVAIDVNSGRSTREHNIEDTAVRTNIEAAEEVARQLRLRDLAGLIVVDFIDMDEHRNNRSVERKLKDALKSDRARIQVGRISHFGLLEMSRQRMRPGVLEGSSVVCPHCMGAGTVRSTASIALHVLRLVEEALLRNNSYNLIVKSRASVALYILNQKRSHLRELEERFGVDLIIDADETLTGSIYHAIERGEPASGPAEPMRPRQVQIDSISPWEGASAPAEDDSADAMAEPIEDADGDGDEAGGDANGDDAEQRRRKRRRRRRGRDREASGVDAGADQPSDDGLAIIAEIKQPVPGEPTIVDAALAGDGEPGADAGEAGGRRDRDRNRRRRRRGGREFEGAQGEGETAAPAQAQSGEPVAPAYAGAASAEFDSAPTQAAEPSYHNGGWTLTPPEAAPASTEAVPAPAPVETAPAPAPVSSRPVDSAEASDAAEQARRLVPDPLPEAPPPEQKKSGWWSRMRGQ